MADFMRDEVRKIAGVTDPIFGATKEELGKVVAPGINETQDWSDFNNE